MSDIRAEFEPGSWQDFSKQHSALRAEVERCLNEYQKGKNPGQIGVWGAFGAGKTQFLFWVAEKCIELGLVPVYLHLNDLIDGLPEASSPDSFSERAGAHIAVILEKLHQEPTADLLVKSYRDKNLLKFITERIPSLDSGTVGRPVLLIDEVEQAYKTLRERVRVDDRSPLRAWLDQEHLKVCAFAVGSLYVLGSADRERLRVWPIPVVRPTHAKQLLSDLPEAAVNALWLLARGKPRHLMKAAHRFRATKPSGPIEVREFVKELDAVSQAPYESDSQNAVPAAYTDQLDDAELAGLLSIGPRIDEGNGRLFRINDDLERELVTTVRDAFKLEQVAYDLVRYILMLLEAVSVDGCFALSESDTSFLLRFAVDFLLEYERERIEKDTVESGAALRKLLDVHDSASQRAGEVFWKLQGKLAASDVARCSISFAALSGAFPLPTTSPTLFGTKPSGIRSKYQETKQPVFSWSDPIGNSIVFLASIGALESHADTPAFRERALAPKSGVIVLVPYDAEDWKPKGLLEWLHEHGRLRVLHLPLALTDFLLSLREYEKNGDDPFPIAQQAESKQNLQRQVAFYSSRLRAFVDEAVTRPKTVIPTEMPKRFSGILSRVADRSMLELAAQQAFETLSPRISGFLIDLRDLVSVSKSLWSRSGHVSLADDMLPHRSPRNDRPEQSQIIEDLKTSFDSHSDSLQRLAQLVSQSDMEFVSDDPACKIALRSLWNTKRSGVDSDGERLVVYGAQLTDLVATLRTATDAENRLRAKGIVVDFGTIGILIQALPQLDKVSADANSLIATPGGSDGRIATAMFENFIGTLLESVQSDGAKAKAALTRIRNALDGLDETKRRITDAAVYESAQFAGLRGADLDQLMAALAEDSTRSLGPKSSPDDVAKAVEVILQDYEEVESLLARLNSAHGQISSLLATS